MNENEKFDYATFKAEALAKLREDGPLEGFYNQCPETRKNQNIRVA